MNLINKNRAAHDAFVHATYLSIAVSLGKHAASPELADSLGNAGSLGTCHPQSNE